MNKVFDLLIINVIPLLISVILHEISHGFVAYVLGDDTAKRAGRFKLHTHFDLYGSFIIPLTLYISNSPFLFGYAKPVPIDCRKFENQDLDMAIVAIAGPLCNALLAVFAAFILKNCDIHSQLCLQFFFNFTVINLSLFLFNLIPIPPLDGSRILTLLLPYKLKKMMYTIEPYGIFILIGIEIICSQISNLLGYKVGIFSVLNIALKTIINMIFDISAPL